MAGHSKWAQIKRKKGALDAKRAKTFTRLIKELTVASKIGGPDPKSNPRLRLAIQNAKAANMPKDTIERAIKKGTSKDVDNLQDLSYEGYAPGGIAVFIEATTDNSNRTVANIRSIFNKYGGNLSTSGSLSFIFDRKGVFTIPVTKIKDFNEDDFIMEIIDAGADDIVKEDDIYIIYTSFENFGTMQKKLEIMNIEPENAELQRIAKNTVKLPVNNAIKVLKMIEKLEEDEDVQNVYHNLELTDELQKELEKEI